MNSINRSSWNDLKVIESSDSKRARLEKDVQAWLKKGNKIEVIPTGVSKDHRVFPNRATRAAMEGVE